VELAKSLREEGLWVIITGPDGKPLDETKEDQWAFKRAWGAGRCPAGAAVLVVPRLGADAQDHRPSRAAARGNREAHGVGTMPMEFIFGRPLSPEELEMIRSQILAAGPQ
jgi:hypothetical protein